MYFLPDSNGFKHNAVIHPFISFCQCVILRIAPFALQTFKPIDVKWQSMQRTAARDIDRNHLHCQLHANRPETLMTNVCFGRTMGLQQNCRLRMCRECWERFPRHRWLAMWTYITARVRHTNRDACRIASLTSGLFLNRWRIKLSRHSWRMRNP